MYLRSLRLVGFKSFADRTRLELRPGVTVVVGPNGTGKSNLVDAVAWVMGTQSTRSLRTERMDDVIFSGTATRPSLGRAEVSLVFDNASRMLPLDLDEVAITRRLHRDGTSEYEINGVGCRLLDVQELLADSGVGRTQHVIIGQGQVDSILNAGPEEHRAVIEEAAGVLKHRLRKERSLRRLERTDADVVRLTDLLGELHRRLRPLRRQAEAAGRHEALATEVRALRLHLGGDELRRLGDRLDQCADEHQVLQAGVAAADTEAIQLAQQVDRLERAESAARATLDRDTGAAARLETTAERLRRVAQVAHERAAAVEARLQGAGERRRDLEDEAGRIEADLARSAGDLIVTRRQAERADSELQRLEDEERSHAEQGDLPAEGAAALVRGELRALEAEAERDARESEGVQRRLEVLRGQVDGAGDELEALRAEIRELDTTTALAQDAYEAARRTREEDQQRWESAEAAVTDARLEEAAAAARLEALEASVAGMADPETVALAASLPGVLGPVRAALDVPSHLAAAVDAALGNWAESLLVTGPDALERAVQRIQAEGSGGVALVLAPQPPEEAPAAAAETGVAALVDGLGPDSDRSLAAALLGDVVVTEGWSTAWRLVKGHPQLRAVTPKGDLIGAGSIRVARRDGASPGIVDAARERCRQASLQIARAESIHTSSRRAFELSRQQERSALEELEGLEARLAGAAAAMQRLENTKISHTEETARLEQRVSALGEAESARAGRVAVLRDHLAALEGDQAERVRAVEEAAERRRRVALARAEAQRERGSAAAALGAVEERRALLERRLRQVRHELQSSSERPADPGELVRLGRVEDHARRTLEVVRAQVATLRTRQSAARSELAGLVGELRRARGRTTALQTEIEAGKERLGSLAVELAELRVRIEATAEGLRRDADATEEEALAAAAPSLPEGSDAATRLETLEAELRRLGPVNPLALDEHRELSERHDFLRAQLDDLERSRSELRKVIGALDQEISGLFAAAFDEVGRAYEEHFTLLFPGGRGRLRLSDPGDVLGSGVEIEAQPLGKRIGRLSLLSGGERSLAALAFLFAVFEARPSPFYVLDEVEAALDDANLRRFLRMVDRFRSRAQVVIVTHQQQTMEGADLLYGVTMEPGGSSRVLAQLVRDPVAAG